MTSTMSLLYAKQLIQSICSNRSAALHGPNVKTGDRRKEVLALCGERGGAPAVLGIEAPRPRLEAVRIVDMSTSNALGRICRVLSPDWPGLPGA